MQLGPSLALHPFQPLRMIINLNSWEKNELDVLLLTGSALWLFNWTLQSRQLIDFETGSL